MPDEQYNTDQLDTIEHPTLGPLKFPHEMPFDERNKIIEGMERQKPAAAAKPTKADNSVEKAGGNEGFFSKVMRGGALGAFQGAGVTESQRPVTDTVKNFGRFAKTAMTAASPNPDDRAKAVDTLYTQPRNEAEAAASRRMDKGGFWNKTLGLTQGVVGEVPLVGPGISRAINEGTTGVQNKDPEQAAHGISSGIMQAAMLGAGTKGGQAATEAALDASLRKVTGPAMRVARESIGTTLSPQAATTARPAGAFQPALANIPKDVLDHAAQEGIHLTPAQATESPTMRTMQAAGERGFAGSKTLNDAVEENRMKFGQAVNRLSERVDPQRLGISEEQAGESIRQAAETAKDVAHTNATDAYKNIKWLDSVPVDVSGIRSKYAADLRNAQTVLGNAPPEVAAKIKGALERGADLGTPDTVSRGTPDANIKAGGLVSKGNIGGVAFQLEHPQFPGVTAAAKADALASPEAARQVMARKLTEFASNPLPGQDPAALRKAAADLTKKAGSSPEVSFKDAIQLRSFFRDMGQTAGADLPKQYQGIFKRLAGDLDSAMESSAKSAGGEKEWREANAGWKEYSEKYGDKQSPLYKILDTTDPAKIARELMNRASAHDVEILKKEGMDSALEPLRRQVLQDIARNKFTVGRDGLGGYQDSFLQQLFGPDVKKELYLKADLARRLNWEVNPSGTSNVLLAEHQFDKPSVMAKLFGAAKASMPRPATSYLPGTKSGQLPLALPPAFLRGAIASTRAATNQ